PPTSDRQSAPISGHRAGLPDRAAGNGSIGSGGPGAARHSAHESGVDDTSGYCRHLFYLHAVRQIRARLVSRRLSRALRSRKTLIRRVACLAWHSSFQKKQTILAGITPDTLLGISL